MSPANKNDPGELAGFEWIRAWLQVVKDGDALMEPGNGAGYPATRYLTTISSRISERPEEKGLDLLLLAGAENDGFFPGIMLGERRLATDEFFFALVDEHITLSLHLDRSCEASEDLYRDASVTFTASGTRFTGQIVSTCHRRHVFLSWAGSTA